MDMLTARRGHLAHPQAEPAEEGDHAGIACGPRRSQQDAELLDSRGRRAEIDRHRRSGIDPKPRAGAAGPAPPRVGGPRASFEQHGQHAAVDETDVDGVPVDTVDSRQRRRQRRLRRRLPSSSAR